MLRVSEVAKMLSIHPSTVVQLIHRGHFPGAHKIDPTRRNSHYFIPAEEVEAYQKLQLGQDPQQASIADDSEKPSVVQ